MGEMKKIEKKTGALTVTRRHGGLDRMTGFTGKSGMLEAIQKMDCLWNCKRLILCALCVL
jgi:hypothetical protein